MDIRGDLFDLWVYCRAGGEARYLLMRTSQEKADKFFGGGRFWQVPGDFFGEGEPVVDAIRRHLRDLGLEATAIWAVEHCYTVYNRRRNDIEIIPVFAAEVDGPREVPLTWEHSEARWFTAAEAHAAINFRGLHEGLDWTRQYVTENAAPGKEFRLA